jgi:hypothetical protein
MFFALRVLIKFVDVFTSNMIPVVQIQLFPGEMNQVV